MFLSLEDQAVTEEYLDQGYVIRPVKDRQALDWIRSLLVAQSHKCLHISPDDGSDVWLNQIHERVPVSDLNAFRLEIISSINAEVDLRLRYFELAKPWLEPLAGNELAMQLRINLSIQMPRDDSSLLPVHADTWSGDSPYEVVVWVPMVDCFKTKSMYLLPPEAARRLRSEFARRAGSSSEDLFQAIESEVVWLEVPYGQVLIFDQGLPHGNRVNEEPETRWSMNCRFKGVFTPYGDKKIGEFFEPITLRAASRNGMSYQYPEVS